MRSSLFILFAVLVVVPAWAGPDGDDGTVTNEELNFSVSMPDSMDWSKEKLPTDKRSQAIKAHFATLIPDTDSRCDVHVMVMKLTRENAKMTLEKIANRWAATLEATLTRQRDVKSEAGKLGGVDCWRRSVKGELTATTGHCSWSVAKMGQYIYIFYVMRSNKLVDDPDLEDEIKSIRDSFKFLKEIKVAAHKDAKGGEGPPGAGAGAGPDPKTLAKQTLHLRHWRLKLVKPQGLVNIEPKSFTAADKSSNVVAKFSGRAEQTAVMIWVHAQIESAQRYTIEQEAESTIKHWKNDKAYKQRLEPEVNNRYKKKVPLAKDAIQVKLVGRRAVPDTNIWVFAQCRNGRQYKLRIYCSGATAEKDWAKQIKAVLKGFKPQKK